MLKNIVSYSILLILVSSWTVRSLANEALSADAGVDSVPVAEVTGDSPMSDTIGCDAASQVTDHKNSYSYNVSENTTSYNLSLYQKSGLALGDELKLSFAPLGIDSFSRIVGWELNPFNYKEVQITVGQYLPTINDSLFSVIDEVQDITETTAKYTVEFGELIGNGSFYFTRAYRDRPYFMIQTDDGSAPVIELTRREGSACGEYVGATLSGVSSTTVSVVAFYCTIPDEDE